MRTRLWAWFLFFGFLGLGLEMASQRPLWNDEYYSLISSTMGTPYKTILSGGIQEGNNSPLFYLLQKIQCDVFSYRPPKEWTHGHWETAHHIYSRVFLRLQSVIAVAAALSILFYFFTRYAGLWAGLYALLVALSSFMLGQHWTEARPYALWFALSIGQMLLLLNILQDKSEHKKKLAGLTLVHWLLALTTTISVVQIMAAGVVLWVSGKRSWKFYIFCAALPLAVVLFYYQAAPKYHFFFADGPMALINANIPKDRMLLILVFAAVFFWRHWSGKGWLKAAEGRYLLFTVLMLAAFAAVLVKLKLGEAGPNQAFQVSNRYFMPLAATDIVGTTLFSIYLVRTFHPRYLKIIVCIFIGLLLVFRMHKTYRKFIDKIYSMPIGFSSIYLDDPLTINIPFYKIDMI